MMKRSESKRKANFSKRASTSDMPCGRKNSNAATNPFFLPDFDEENYEPTVEKTAASETQAVSKAPTIWRKGSKAGISFKKVAKAITQQRKWSSVLTEVQQSDDHTRARGFVATSDDGQRRLSFNVNAFKPHVQSCGTLSQFVKRILRSYSWVRTDEEIEVVLQLVKRLNCFDRYPMYVKRELAKVLYYDTFDKGRVVIKQGHVGISFYFIVSGSVIVERMEEDKYTKEQHKQVVGEMSEGDAFGELALLHDIRRTATIICKENSEFLRVDKPDFDEVLLNSHQIEWERKLSVLTSQPVLKDWANTEIRQTVGHTKLREYPPNTVILGNIEDPTENVHFIQSGKCKVVREITMVCKEFSSGKTRFTLPPINCTAKTDNSANNKGKEVKKFLIIHMLGKGDFFGVGEDLKNTYIISVGRVHCVLISQIIFRKRERGKTLEALKKQLTQAFPSQEEAFERYIENRNWRIYKKKMVDQIIKKKKRLHRTKFDDVPVVVRAENAHYLDTVP